eukprot:m.295853 g.295853  ORF g.295853 m.295853 type:complete len:183 (+) comp40760_c1_seq57:2704-3252(+)
MQIPLKERGRSALRSLGTLREDHAKFQAAGAKLKTAKHYNNVISENLFDIELSHVAIPPLHVSLGIFSRIFDLFSKSADEIDVALRENSLRDFSAKVRAADEVENKIKEIGEKETYLSQLMTWQYLNCPTENPEAVRSLQDKILCLRREADILVLHIIKICGTLLHFLFTETEPLLSRKAKR